MAQITYKFQNTDKGFKRYKVLGRAMVGTGKICVNGTRIPAQIEVCWLPDGYFYAVHMVDRYEPLLCEEVKQGTFNDLIKELSRFEDHMVILKPDGKWSFSEDP